MVQITCDRAELERSIEAVREACSRLRALSTYVAIHASVREDAMELHAHNGEIAAWHALPVTADGSTCFSVAHTLFRNAIAAMPTAVVGMTVPPAGTLHIFSEDQRIVFKLKQAETIDAVMLDKNAIVAEKIVLGRLAAKDLAYMVFSTQFVLDRTNEHIPLATLGHFCIHKDTASLEATDGYRLAICSAALEQPTGQTKDVVVAARALDALRTMLLRLTKPEDTVELACTPHHLLFSSGQWLCAISILPQQYPDTGRVLERTRQQTRKLTVERDQLADALRRAVAVATKIHAPTRLDITANAVTLRTGNETTGVSEAIPAQADPPDPCAIAVNPGFLYDALTFVRTQTMTLTFSDKESPIMLQDGTWTYVLMPVKLTT